MGSNPPPVARAKESEAPRPIWLGESEPAALSATLSVAVKLAAEAGVKVTEMVQIRPAARVVPQVVRIG